MRAPLVLTLLGVLFVVFPNQSNGALYIYPGPCPGDYKLGDVWLLDQCRSATCREDSYVVASCGVAYIEHDPTICYLQYNKTLPYPGCCTPALVCAGDPGFGEINLVG